MCVSLQLVPYRATVRFTLLQLVYLLGVWALTTWAGIAGVAFPLPIMALVPLRQFVLPRLFDPVHLSQLDAAEYEEAPAVTDRREAVQVCELGPCCWCCFVCESLYDPAATMPTLLGFAAGLETLNPLAIHGGDSFSLP